MAYRYTPVYFHDIDMSDLEYQDLQNSVHLLCGEADPARWHSHVSNIAMLMIHADITGPLKTPADQGPDRYSKDADFYAEKCRSMLYAKTAFGQLLNEQRDMIVSDIARLFEERCWVREAGKDKPTGRPLFNKDIFEERLDVLSCFEDEDKNEVFFLKRVARLAAMFIDIPPSSTRADFNRIAAKDSLGQHLLRLHISAYRESRPKDSIISLPSFVPEALYREYGRQYELRYR